MVEINPEYGKYVRFENGRNVLYLRIIRAIYGCIELALQWYILYKMTLEKEGFMIIPYDFCVANKTINGKQCTIAWYVDDNKLSHIDPEVVNEILEILKRHFGDLKVTWGKHHKFLGMDISLIGNGKFEVSMKEQLQDAIDSFGEKMNRVVSSPEQLNLFNVNDEAVKLIGKKKEVFTQ